MGDQRWSIAFARQKYRAVLLAGGESRSRCPDPNSDSQRAGAGDHCADTVLQEGKSMSYPENLKYTKEHEWVLVSADSGTIGITDHAQHELGDIVFVDLPRLGAHLKRGESLGSVESVKAVSDIYAPVSGEVTETNPI